MKAEIKKNGTLLITAETVVEAFALNQIACFDDSDKFCPSFVVLDCSILNKGESKQTEE